METHLQRTANTDCQHGVKSSGGDFGSYEVINYFQAEDTRTMA